MAQSFESWWVSLGPFTRTTLIGSAGLSVATRLGVLSPTQLMLSWHRTLQGEIWRPLTAGLFLGPLNFPTLLNIAMLVIYQQRLEEDYRGRMPDHLFCLLSMYAGLLTLSVFFPLRWLGIPLTMSLLWVWCKRHEEQLVTLYGFAFRARHFPWVMVAFHLLMGGTPTEDVVGIVTGHVFFFLRDVVPQLTRFNPLRTPRWVEKLFPGTRQHGPRRFQGSTGVSSANPTSHSAGWLGTRRSTHWGKGRQLGGE